MDKEHELPGPYEFSVIIDEGGPYMTDEDVARAAMRLQKLGAVPMQLGLTEDEMAPLDEEANVVHVRFD